MTISTTTSSSAPHHDPPGTSAVIDTPVPGVRVIRAVGELDQANAARLLRLLDTQLMLARSGHLQLHTVIVDLSPTQTIGRAGLAAFAHARYSCGRLGLTFALAGTSGPVFLTSIDVRARLGQFRMFPTVDAAVNALTEDRASATAPPGPAPTPAIPIQAAPEQVAPDQARAGTALTRARRQPRAVADSEVRR